MIVGVKRWALVVGIACVPAAFFGTMIARWQSSPTPPPPCNEAVAVIGKDGHDLINCNVGDRLEVVREGTVILAKCLCTQRKSAEAQEAIK